MTKRLTDDIVKAIREARESGMSVTAIAVEFDVDASTVSKRCAGIPQPANVRPGPKPVDCSRVVHLYSRGVAREAIVERLGISRRLVSKALAAAGAVSGAQGRKVAPEVVEAIRSAWRSGAGTLAIANAHGVSLNTVRNYTRDMARPHRAPANAINGTFNRSFNYRRPSYALEAAE